MREEDIDLRSGLGRQVDEIDWNYEVSWDDIIIEYGNDYSDIRGVEQDIGFGRWCMERLLENKKTDSNFRNHVILVDVKPYLGADVIFKRDEFVLDEDLISVMKEYDDITEKRIRDKYEIGDTISVMLLTWYSALRSRNDKFTKLSFTMNEHDWDELSDIL